MADYPALRDCTSARSYICRHIKRCTAAILKGEDADQLFFDQPRIILRRFEGHESFRDEDLSERIWALVRSENRIADEYYDRFCQRCGKSVDGYSCGVCVSIDHFFDDTGIGVQYIKSQRRYILSRKSDRVYIVNYDDARESHEFFEDAKRARSEAPPLYTEKATRRRGCCTVQ